MKLKQISVTLTRLIILSSYRRQGYNEHPASFKGLVDAEEFKIINLI
jgi:hypothetical protein